MGMTDVQQSGSSERGDQPGKTRTWWHPLLARMLDYALGSAFKVEHEVSVGKMPFALPFAAWLVETNVIAQHASPCCRW